MTNQCDNREDGRSRRDAVLFPDHIRIVDIDAHQFQVQMISRTGQPFTQFNGNPICLNIICLSKQTQPMHVPRSSQSRIAHNLVTS